MRSAAIWLCLFGCSFDPKAVGVVPGTDGAPPDEAPPVDSPLDPPPDTEPAVSPGCELLPDGLVACFQFEDDLTGTVLADGSGHGNAAATGFMPTTRPFPADSQALLVTNSSAAKVANVTAHNLNGNFAITTWMRPDNPNPADNEGIIDHEGAWALSIAQGNLQCWSGRTNGGLFLVNTTDFENNAWQFVACQVNGNQGCIHRIDLDGNHRKVCAQITSTGSNGGNGFSIGSFQDGGGGVEDRFNGAIDDLRVYSRALPDTELCTLSGHTQCPLQ